MIAFLEKLESPKKQWAKHDPDKRKTLKKQFRLENGVSDGKYYKGNRPSYPLLTDITASSTITWAGSYRVSKVTTPTESFTYHRRSASFSIDAPVFI